MANELYLDDVHPGEPHDSASFCTIVEVSGTRLAVKTDAGELVFMEFIKGGVPPEAKVGMRKIFREALS